MYGETRQTKNDVVGWDRFLVSVVQEFAKENNIKLDLISAGWIMRLQKKDVTRFIFGLDLGLNNSASKLLARDKAATSDILALGDIPYVEHKLFLRPESLGSNPNGNWTSIIKYFKECNGDVVCKPNMGSGGIDVERANTQPALERIVQELFRDNRTVAISPYVDMSAEYRVTVLDGKAELVYKKVKRNDENLKFNLCKGAYAQEVNDIKELEETSKLAVQAANAIGIRFTNVDIAACQDFSILEINSGVMFEHYAKQGTKEEENARRVYRKALSTLF